CARHEIGGPTLEDW
nr:immunoglobulin heavy chain junction region [Macaca mulatta]MOX92370.1 immunoglobulin heavy chain junction region [Macaca mulatta]MOX94142.1 immunoglobulin heavy chain junction region [Macaca mulatta]MOX94332.1 immunoglobulin heavy chain junction region [Macaca mulatta]MOX95557.1 immunoglobulin heavy chain junction region [Macaca mulatta]